MGGLPEHRRATERRRRCYLQHKKPSQSHLNRATPATTTSTISICLKYCSSSFFWLKVGISSLASAMVNKSTRYQRRHRFPATVPVDDVIKENKRSTAERRLELEKEVGELQKKLDHEEKVRNILDVALRSRKNGETILQLPNSTPKKTRDLLAEIVMVEAEIERLEAAISTIQEETRSTEKHNQASHILENPLFENKPMFFINQAIKGGGHHHHCHDLRSSSTDHQSPKSKSLSLKPKENKNSSTSRRPIQPNKLSEKIMKCLICIFLRLVRPSVGARSFGEVTSEVDSCEPKSCSFRQQDPYGIFKFEEALVRDVGHYKHLVICRSTSLMDVKAMTDRCSPLIKKLRVLLRYLSEVELTFFTYQQQLAFWINIYNTIILHGILENGLPSNPDELLSLRNKIVLNVGGIKLNALTIEHMILKQRRSDSTTSVSRKDDNGYLIRRVYGLDRPEPNITFALCNGNKSSPAVRIYTAENVPAELEKAKLEYLQASIVVTASQRVMIPSLLTSKMNSFAYDLGSLLLWICNQLPVSGSLRRSMVACFRGSENGDGSSVVDIIPSELDFQLLLLPI